MRYITQCPQCQTHFRVVADQLKLSDGWVRCGQCAEVFDARSHIQPWEDKTASPALPTEPRVATAVTPDHKAAQDVHPTAGLAGHGVDVDLSFEDVGDGFAAKALSGHQPTGLVEGIEGIHHATALDAAAEATHEGNAEHFGGDSHDLVRHLEAHAEGDLPPATESEQPPPPQFPPAPLPEQAAAGDAQPQPPSLPESGPVVSPVSFVRQAQRRAFWRQGWVRGALGALVLLLGLGLAGQVMVVERNRLAALLPAAQPGLESLCQLLGCEVEPWRDAAALAVDSSALVRLDDDRYRFEVTLKNTALHAVATPAVELSLTNASDDVVLRRVILAADWGHSSPVLLPLSLQALTVELLLQDAATLRMAGYRALVFYP